MAEVSEPSRAWELAAMPASTGKHARRAREKRPKKAAAPVPRDANGHFLKGVSGNPSGRPLMDKVVREFAGAHSIEAVETVIKIMRDPKVAKETRLAAARTILDRAVGKAAQPITGMPGSGLVNINLNGGSATVSATDAADAYRAICGDPTIDLSQIQMPAPAPRAQQRIEQRKADPLASPPGHASKLAVWPELAK